MEYLMMALETPDDFSARSDPDRADSTGLAGGPT
jgi:hypothetical protein